MFYMPIILNVRTHFSLPLFKLRRVFFFFSSYKFPVSDVMFIPVILSNGQEMNMNAG